MTAKRHPALKTQLKQWRKDRRKKQSLGDESVLRRQTDCLVDN